MFKTLNKQNQIKFKTQITISAIIVVIWAILLILNIEPTKVYTGKCGFYFGHGIFCPGCGGTRAFENLLHFRFLTSFIYHPIVVSIIFLLFFSDISYLLYFITRGKVLFYELKMPHFVAIDLIFVLNFIIKNLLVLYFGFYIF